MPYASRGPARLLSAIAALLLCVGAVGCLAFPSKMTMRRYGNGGVTLQSADVDFAFIKIGVTSRDEVAKRLKAVDVDAPAQFFWGRWVESSWGFAGGSLPLSSSGAPTAGSMRHWRYRNLLVKFNDQGVAVEQSVIDNEKLLWRQLMALLRESQTPAKFETIQLHSAVDADASAILSPEGIELKAANRKKDLAVTFPSQLTIRLLPRFRPQALTMPELTCFELQVATERGASKRSFQSCASARNFVHILAYLDRLPAPAKWQDKP